MFFIPIKIKNWAINPNAEFVFYFNFYNCTNSTLQTSQTDLPFLLSSELYNFTGRLFNLFNLIILFFYIAIPGQINIFVRLRFFLSQQSQFNFVIYFVGPFVTRIINFVGPSLFFSTFSAIFSCSFFFVHVGQNASWSMVISIL
jgi:hypothetical protein